MASGTEDHTKNEVNLKVLVRNCLSPNYRLMPDLIRCLPALATAILLASCSTTPTAPEPVEFTRSADQLSSIFPDHQQLGIATLYGKDIQTSRDAQGRTVYQATGGAVLVKKSVPAISAKGPEIELDADKAVVRGRSVVKKTGMLYIGETDSSKIIIDGVFLSFEGPHSVMQAGPARMESPAPPVVTPAQPKSKPASVSKPKPKPASVKPAPAKPAPVDRSRLLELMREPKEG